MSDLAEVSRLLLLKDAGDRAVRRAERLGAHIQRIWDGDGEPTTALINEYTNACKAAEVALLNRALAMSPDGTEDE